MNRHLCIFYACLLIACSVNLNASAQPTKKLYDRFVQETANLKDDTNKIIRCLDFVNDHKILSPDSNFYFFNYARALSVKLNYPKGVFLSAYMEGDFAEIRNNFPLAIDYYKEAIKIAETNKLYDDIYLVYTDVLNLYYYQADYPNAMDIAQKGLVLAERYHIKQDEAHYINQIGFIYLKQENADESIKYYMQYLALAKEMNNKVMVADACNGVADGYLLKNDCKAALHYFFTALNIYSELNEDKNPSLDRKRTANRHERMAYTLFKISSAYKQAGDYNKALYYSLQIFDMYNKRKKKGIPTFNSYDLASYYINMGDIYRRLKNYRQAGISLNEGLSISKSILHREDMRDAYEGLSKNFASQKRYDSAYYYHVLFTSLKDSILNEKVSREINSLEVARRDKTKRNRNCAA
jgi:two-component system NarL family sensor kinase